MLKRVAKTSVFFMQPQKYAIYKCKNKRIGIVLGIAITSVLILCHKSKTAKCW